MLFTRLLHLEGTADSESIGIPLVGASRPAGTGRVGG